MKWLRRIFGKKAPVVDEELSDALDDAKTLAEECCNVLKEKTAALNPQLICNHQTDNPQPVVEPSVVPNETSEGRSVPSVSPTNAGASASMAQHRGVDQPETPASVTVQPTPDQCSPESGKVDEQDSSAKQAAENPPSSFPNLESKSDPEIMVGIEPKKQIEPKPNDIKFEKRNPEAEPPLRPRKEWEKWSKRQGNTGSETHAEWKRRASEAGIQMGESDEK